MDRLLSFLPMTREEMNAQNISQLDFIIVTGDAYVDHPSYGIALIGRLLQSKGYSVGVIAQPNWQKSDDFTLLGTPRLAFLVSAGNMDSLVNNYTSAGKPRREDLFSPGGVGGKRPDRATLVYCTKIKESFKGIPIIIGGIEASLRRLGHYDYWSNKVRHSLLLDSKADLLVYGMGERQIVEIADELQKGTSIKDLTNIRGTVFITSKQPEIVNSLTLPTFDQIKKDKKAYAESFMMQHENTDAITGRTLIEPDGSRFVVQNPPALPVEESELDAVYELPYTRKPHWIYDELGGVPAMKEVQYSLASSRGCFGGCNFCALTFHQGRRIQARSHESLLKESKELIADPDFKGYIHDVGGPTANFRKPSCEKQITKGVCAKKQCLFPKPCNKIDADHSDYTDLLKKLRNQKGVKKVFIRSGIRYDYLLEDSNDAFLEELVQHHVSGRLKIAPEHIDDTVLHAMGKPGSDVFERFVEKYHKVNKKFGKRQQIVPYFISSHPGSDIHAAIKLAEYMRDHGIKVDQVQDFLPTPGTMSTCMFYTGLDPRTMKPIYVAYKGREKNMQRALLHYYKPENRKLVIEALQLAGREDLIGQGKGCLVSGSYKGGRGSMDSSQNSLSHKKQKRNQRRKR